MCQDRGKTGLSYKFSMLSAFQGETDTEKKQHWSCVTRPYLARWAFIFPKETSRSIDRAHFRLDILCFLSRAYSRGRERPEIRQASFMFLFVSFMRSFRYCSSASSTTLCRYFLNVRIDPEVVVSFIIVSSLWFFVWKLERANTIRMGSGKCLGKMVGS